VGWSTNYETVGGGGLMSSVEDLLLWDRNFYENKLGKGTLIKELQTHGILNDGKQTDYALGLFMSTYRGLADSGSRWGEFWIPHGHDALSRATLLRGLPLQSVRRISA
jgi:hypothetical protein